MKIYNSPEITIIDCCQRERLWREAQQRDMKIWMIFGQIGNYITNSENSSSVQI